MKRTVMYTDEQGNKYFKLGGSYFLLKENATKRKRITQEEYENAIATIDENNIIESPICDELHFDYRELKKEIESQYKSVSNFSRAIGIAETAMWRKLANRNEFSVSEIFMIMYKLNLTDFKKYFFTPLKLEVTCQDE